MSPVIMQRQRKSIPLRGCICSLSSSLAATPAAYEDRQGVHEWTSSVGEPLSTCPSNNANHVPLSYRAIHVRHVEKETRLYQSVSPVSGYLELKRFGFHSITVFTLQGL